MTTLCTVPSCRLPGRHGDGCTYDGCCGCLVALAADGLRLCRHHTDGIGRDALQAGALYAELELVLGTGDGPGERTSGSREPNAALNEPAAEARSTIRYVLVSWTRLVAEERGISLPDDTIPAIARFLARHADWLAAHPAAGDCADELHELAHGRPWRVAYPTGARVFTVGVCPQHDEHGPCAGVVRAILRRTDALLPSELVCDTDEAHRWTADQWRTLFRALRPDGTVARSYTAYQVAGEWRLPLGTVYRLAHNHGWRRSNDGRKPVLYVAADVEATMSQREREAAA